MHIKFYAICCRSTAITQIYRYSSPAHLIHLRLSRTSRREIVNLHSLGLYNAF